MKYVNEKLKQSNNESIIISVITIIIGLIMILFSSVVLDIISYLIGGIVIIIGFMKIYYYFKNNGKYNIYNYDLSMGIIYIILGILCIIFKSEIQSIFRILIGIFIMYEGIFKISLATKLCSVNKSIGFLSFLLVILMVLCSLFIIFNKGIVIATIGYILIIFSIIDIIQSLIFKKNLKKLEKYFNEKNIK